MLLISELADDIKCVNRFSTWNLLNWLLHHDGSFIVLGLNIRSLFVVILLADLDPVHIERVTLLICLSYLRLNFV